MAKQKRLNLRCTSAFMAGGKMILPRQIISDVPEADARALVRRGKAKVIEDSIAGDDDAGDKALAGMTVDELKEVAAELEIEGVGGMKKAELVAAIEAAEAGGE